MIKIYYKNDATEENLVYQTNEQPEVIIDKCIKIPVDTTQGIVTTYGTRYLSLVFQQQNNVYELYVKLKGLYFITFD